MYWRSVSTVSGRVSRMEILAKSDSVYSGAEALFPFLEFADKGVKPMAFSRLMSACS